MMDVGSTSVARAVRVFAAIAVATALTTTGLIATTGAEGATAATAQTTPAPSTFPPTAPSNLVAASVKANSVTLTWTASTPGCCPIAGYAVSYAQPFHDVFYNENVGNVTTVTITANIRPTTQYTFRVSANDTMGYRSGSSNAVTVVTPASDEGPDTIAPQAPTNLVATNDAAGVAVLSWSPSTDNVGVTGYEVYHYDGWFTSRVIATVTGTTTVAYGSPGRNVFYVRARDAAGNISIASNTVVASTTTPGPISPSVSPPACRVTYSLTSRWASGFVADVALTNTGPTAVNGWTLAYTFGGDQRIASVWHATFSQSGADVSLRNAAWNRTIAPGGRVTIGMLGSWASSDAAPTAFSLNGVACAVS